MFRFFLQYDRNLYANAFVNESGSFRPKGCFGLGRFGQFLGWVVSALVGESFLAHVRGKSFRPWVVSAARL